MYWFIPCGHQGSSGHALSNKHLDTKSQMTSNKNKVVVLTFCLVVQLQYMDNELDSEIC